MNNKIIGIISIIALILIAAGLHHFFNIMGIDFVLGGLFVMFIYQFGYYAAHGKWIEF
jgi:hypothetical protein